MNAIFIVIISLMLLALVCNTYSEYTMFITTLPLANESETGTLDVITRMATENEISVKNTTASKNRTDMFKEDGNRTTSTEVPHDETMNILKILEKEKVILMPNDAANVKQSTTTTASNSTKTSMENSTEVLTSTSNPSNSQKIVNPNSAPKTLKQNNFC